MEKDCFSANHHPKTSDYLRWKSGKRVDSRLLILLELLEEIYSKRRDFFKKIFEGNHEELFKKIGHAAKRGKMMKAKSMGRSTSMRVINQRGLDDNIDELRLQRFKVKTPNVLEDDSKGAITTTAAASQGGKSKT